MSLCQAGYPEGAAGEGSGHLAGDGVSRPSRGPHVRPRVLHRAPDEPLPPPRRQVPVCPHRQQRVGDPCQAPCARFKTGDFNLHFPEIISIVCQINPYVNGALYSLLGNKEINIVAQDMGIENKIIEKCQVRCLECQLNTQINILSGL